MTIGGGVGFFCESNELFNESESLICCWFCGVLIIVSFLWSFILLFLNEVFDDEHDEDEDDDEFNCSRWLFFKLSSLFIWFVDWFDIIYDVDDTFVNGSVVVVVNGIFLGICCFCCCCWKNIFDTWFL